MSVRWATAFLDFPTAAVQAGVSFWTTVTSYRLSAWRGPSAEFATLLPDAGDAFLRVQRVGADTPRCHLDLHVDDLESRTDLAVAMGARVVGGEPGLVVLRSPGGLSMCLAEVGAESRRPAPAGPPGQQALVDQLCLDIPIDRFDAEADFVARLTGWEHRAGSRPEFDHLLRPPQIPLRLLLQRVAAGGRVGAHLDWACEDVAAEVARHRSQGAEVVRTTSEWTTLRDPAGLEYCLTCRDPSGSGAGVSSTD